MWLSLQKDTCCIPAHKLTVKYKWAPHFALLTVKCENSHVWFEQGSWPSFTSMSRWNVVHLWLSATVPHSVFLHNTWNKTNQSDNNRAADVNMLVMLVWPTLFRSPLKKYAPLLFLLDGGAKRSGVRRENEMKEDGADGQQSWRIRCITDVRRPDNGNQFTPSYIRLKLS